MVVAQDSAIVLAVLGQQPYGTSQTAVLGLDVPRVVVELRREPADADVPVVRAVRGPAIPVHDVQPVVGRRTLSPAADVQLPESVSRHYTTATTAAARTRATGERQCRRRWRGQVQRSVRVQVLRQSVPAQRQPDQARAHAHGRTAVPVRALRTVVQHIVQPATARPQHTPAGAELQVQPVQPAVLAADKLGPARQEARGGRRHGDRHGDQQLGEQRGREGGSEAVRDPELHEKGDGRLDGGRDAEQQHRTVSTGRRAVRHSVMTRSPAVVFELGPLTRTGPTDIHI